MKCASLIQPYATLVVIEAKRFETRSWDTSFRGPVAIHASKGFPRWARELCEKEPFKSVLARAGYLKASDLPRGAVLGIADLFHTSQVTANTILPREPEVSFGDYSVGRFLWHLHMLQKFKEPVPARGMLGLWNWEPPKGLMVT